MNTKRKKEREIGKFILGFICGTIFTLLVIFITVFTYVMIEKDKMMNPTLDSIMKAEIFIGETETAWKFFDLDGNEKTLEDFRGKVVFLNFWTTWCRPCRKEMPSIQSLYDEFKDKNVEFLCMTYEDRETIMKFWNEKDYTFPIYSYEVNTPELFKTKGIPATFIIDRNGKIILKHVGMANWASKDVGKVVMDLLK
ncbi:TlpA family protein disulfide reductase [bacterium]|nr:TlpA family protein disulfide reductase [bacterium]